MVNKIEEFNVRLNKALSFRNMKPVELSERTGISESTISQYRSGYAKPKEKKLAIIANALDVNPSWLMGLDVPMEMPIPKLELNEETQEAIRLYREYVKSSPDIQRMVAYLLKLGQSIPNMPEVPHLKNVKLPKPTAELPHLKKDKE